MPKKCIIEDCKYNVFGHGFCKNHQYKRKDLVRRPSKSRTPIRKVSKKKQQTLGEKKLQREKDWEFYSLIWETRPHVCFETGEPIYGELRTVYMHHVLEKGTEIYKKFRHCDWNIIIVSANTHNQVHSNIDKTPKIKEYRDHLIKTKT